MEYKLVMELLLQEQLTTYNRLMKLQKNFKVNTNVPRAEMTARIELITKYYKKFSENNENIEKVCAKHKIDTSKTPYFEEDLAFKCELLYLSLMGELVESQKTSESAPSVSKTAPKEKTKKPKKPEEPEELKKDLPKLPEVRKFSGEIIDWLDFRAEFLREVHSKSELSSSQKLNILKLVLPDSLLEPIKVIIIMQAEDGYEQAWNILEEKFNKRTLIEEYLQKLLEQPSVNGLPKSIFRLLDQTIKYLNALKSLDVDIKNWDVFLVHILTQKLGERNKTEWQATYSKNELPNLYNFFEFLNSKLQNKEELNEEIKKFKCEEDSKMAGLCLCCKKRHPLWQCDKFEGLSIDERLIFVKNKTVCMRCLSNNHTLADCKKAYTCRICQNRAHHYLLHKNAKHGV